METNSFGRDLAPFQNVCEHGFCRSSFPMELVQFEDWMLPTVKELVQTVAR
jgi:hypothetical protein